MITNVRPLNNKALVEPEAPLEQTGAGVYVPEGAMGRPHRGVVLAFQYDGEEPPLQIGETIIYTKYGGASVEIDGKELLLLDLEDVLAVVDEEN